MKSDELDAAYKNLAAEERRQVMYALAESGETEIKIERIADEETMLSMLHNHLPKLAEGGFVEYEANEDEMVIRRGPRFEELKVFLEGLQDYEEETGLR